MNTLTFFGEVLNGDGTRQKSGFAWRNGPIVTFTGGQNTQNGWGASTANNLESIVGNEVVGEIKRTGSMVLMVSRIRNIHHFDFKAGQTLPRFILRINDDGRTKEILFLEVVIKSILTKGISAEALKILAPNGVDPAAVTFDEVSASVSPNNVTPP